MTQKIKTAIFGASGYTGVELLRLLHTHPDVSIEALSGETQAGKEITEVYPHLRGLGLPRLKKISEIDTSALDLVFCCLPHGTTQEVIAALPESVKVVDLSADFRLRDIDTYEQWYGKPHTQPMLQRDAVYGLTELNREAVKGARLVANPGCYPTSALLPLIPLVKSELISADNIVIDAKSGVTGAGRKVAQSFLYTEVNDSLMAYGIATHRHTPEVEQELGTNHMVTFTPHLVPMNRGILSTIYVELHQASTVDELRHHLVDTYKDEPFMHILPEGELPSTAQVRGSNYCAISVSRERRTGRAIIVSAIDNLTKGSSGQAIHNMNLMFGLPEDTGLRHLALFP
ncbi:MAG: N-acetyl-gamma-glutamyl-phosphate reductase [Rickettsiales bacterium]|nr:N-acetyl-gamma-glutamyl-phosphate reductase [Rickettsiales bacterium]